MFWIMTISCLLNFVILRSLYVLVKKHKDLTMKHHDISSKFAQLFKADNYQSQQHQELVKRIQSLSSHVDELSSYSSAEEIHKSFIRQLKHGYKPNQTEFSRLSTAESDLIHALYKN